MRACRAGIGLVGRHQIAGWSFNGLRSQYMLAGPPGWVRVRLPLVHVRSSSFTSPPRSQGPGLVPHVDYFTHLLWRQLAEGAVVSVSLTIRNATERFGLSPLFGMAAFENVTILALCGSNDGMTQVRSARCIDISAGPGCFVERRPRRGRQHHTQTP